ncbi:MAG: hypothetical protein ABII85_01740 [Bacillota bacterium]
MPKCRFCGNLQIDGATGNPRCEIQDRVVSESYAKRRRACDNYIMIDLPNESKDYFLEIPYREEKTRRKKDGHQLTIDEL